VIILEKGRRFRGRNINIGNLTETGGERTPKTTAARPRPRQVALREVAAAGRTDP
jgi:hypothetical protein